MNRLFIAACLAVACATLASARIAAGHVTNEPVVGCMNTWVSTGTWSVRVAKLQNLPDRVNLFVEWRNDSAKSLKPGGMDGVTHLGITYSETDSIGIFDQVSQGNPGPTTHAMDLLDHRFAPGATYKTVLSFYFPVTYSPQAGLSRVVPRKQKPIEFSTSNGTGSKTFIPITIKLNCAGR